MYYFAELQAFGPTGILYDYRVVLTVMSTNSFYFPEFISKFKTYYIFLSFSRALFF